MSWYTLKSYTTLSISQATVTSHEPIADRVASLCAMYMLTPGHDPDWLLGWIGWIVYSDTIIGDCCAVCWKRDYPHPYVTHVYRDDTEETVKRRAGFGYDAVSLYPSYRDFMQARGDG